MGGQGHVTEAARRADPPSLHDVIVCLEVEAQREHHRADEGLHGPVHVKALDMCRFSEHSLVVRAEPDSKRLHEVVTEECFASTTEFTATLFRSGAANVVFTKHTTLS